jgi:hypothetical protein
MKIYVLSVTSLGLMRHQMAELFLVSISDPPAQGNTQLFCRGDGDDEDHFFEASKDSPVIAEDDNDLDDKTERSPNRGMNGTNEDDDNEVIADRTELSKLIDDDEGEE